MSLIREFCEYFLKRNYWYPYSKGQERKKERRNFHYFCFSLPLGCHGYSEVSLRLLFTPFAISHIFWTMQALNSIYFELWARRLFVLNTVLEKNNGSIMHEAFPGTNSVPPSPSLDIVHASLLFFVVPGPWFNSFIISYFIE